MLWGNFTWGWLEAEGELPLNCQVRVKLTLGQQQLLLL